MRHTTNPHPLESRNRGPQKLRPGSQNFAVPASLRPLANALEANSVLVDRVRLTADLPAQGQPADTSDGRLFALARLFHRSEGGEMSVESLGVSGRSHAFLDLNGGSAWQVQNAYLRPRPGATLVTVYGETSPFRMLARLSDDINLTAAAGSGDVYGWFAETAAVPRRLAKDALLRVLLAQRDPQVLVGTALELAEELNGSVEDAVTAVQEALNEHFGTAVAYMVDRAQYDASPHLAVQAATNRVGNAALVHAHALLSEKNIAEPVVMGAPCEVIYEVPDDRLDDLELRMCRVEVAREGIRMPVRVDILRHG